MLPLLPLFAAITPFILWPIEILLPYPHIIEEAAKTLLIIPLIGKKRSTQIKIAVLIGLLFALSESVLYLFNIFLVGDTITFLKRLLLTIPLHILTTLIILLPTRLDRKLIIAGLIAAILIHYFFNQLVV